MTRDLTKKQFLAALERQGMKPAAYPMSGYIDVGDGLHVYRWNAGDRLRDQLAYLMEQRDYWRRKKANGR